MKKKNYNSALVVDYEFFRVSRITLTLGGPGYLEYPTIPHTLHPQLSTVHPPLRRTVTEHDGLITSRVGGAGQPRTTEKLSLRKVRKPLQRNPTSALDSGTWAIVGAVSVILPKGSSTTTTEDNTGGATNTDTVSASRLSSIFVNRLSLVLRL